MIALTIACFAWILAAVPVAVLIDGARLSTAWLIGVGVLTLGALVGLLVLPGVLMRHVEVHGDVKWVAGAGLVAAIVLAVWAAKGPAAEITPSYGPGRVIPWIPVLLLVVGLVGGLIVDALNRAAASIPTTVGGLLLLVLVGVGVLVAAARR